MLVSKNWLADHLDLTGLSNPEFDSETNTLSITYSDGDGNLPWQKEALIDQNGTVVNLIPDSHTYEEGVRFSGSFSSTDVPDGDYQVHFQFDDGTSASLTLPISVGGGGGCALEGDLNTDGIANVLDIVLLVNLVLGGNDPDVCSDVNGDGILNVLDIVLLVNIVLNS